MSISGSISSTAALYEENSDFNAERVVGLFRKGKDRSSSTVVSVVLISFSLTGESILAPSKKVKTGLSSPSNLLLKYENQAAHMKQHKKLIVADMLHYYWKELSIREV